MITMKRLLAVALALLLAGASAASATVSDSLKAYHRGQLETVLNHWESEASWGDPKAQSVLAAHYLYGLDRSRDEAKAAELFRQAAEQGYTVAQANLGELYRRGIGVRRDLVQAFTWYGIAAENGHRWAARQKEALVAIMDEIDVIDGERAIRHWLDRWFPTELVGQAQVIDGNHLKLDGYRLRLVGIEVPPIGRKCQIGGRDADCGVVARAQLKALTDGARLRCQVFAQRIDDSRAARCYVGGNDVSAGMVFMGWAYARGEHAERYEATERGSRLSANGLWRGDLVIKY
jgi:TPR repeat protein